MMKNKTFKILKAIILFVPKLVWNEVNPHLKAEIKKYLS